MHPQTPTRESQLSPAGRAQIDRQSERFEAAWQSGQRPEIQVQLEDASDAVRPALLRELVALELEYRRRAGEEPSPEEYAVRFPDLVASFDASDFGSHDPESLLGTQSRTATFRPEEASGKRAELPPPEKVGRYEIRSLLGRGAFGAVYLGFDPELKRQVAIKVPRLAAENTAAQIEAFLEEARRAVQLERHQGIVPVYDVGHDGELCYIVSQYIEGGTLSQLLKAGPVPVATAIKLAVTLADVVHFAHRQGWVHRDIKPSNILLDADGNPYLADFGLTSRLDEMRSTDGPPNGTPNYMAPELAREALAQMRRQTAPAALRPDQRSDVYSLGVVLYQLLTGGLPFEADNLVALFDLVLHSDPVPPRLAGAKIPARLEEVCLKALAKEQCDRYRTAADLRDDLCIVAAALSTPESRIEVDERSVWGLTPVRLAAVVGTGVLLLVIVATAIVVANNFWSPPVEHTSPGGETNVAMLNNAAKMGVPAPPGLAPPVPAPRDRVEERALLLGELREMLREENGRLEERKSLPPPGAVVGAAKFSADSPRRTDASLPSFAGPLPPTAADRKLPEAYFRMQADLEAARKQKDAEREYSLLINLGNAQARAGSDAQAIESYAQASKLLPETAAYDARSRLLYNWVASLLAENQLDEATRQIARLREIARPDDPLAQRILKAAEPLLKVTPPDEKK